MAPTPSSALMGQPPLSQDDYDFVRGVLLMADALSEANPANGLPLPVPRPPPGQYVKQSYQNHFIVSASICIILMLLATGTRLAIRCVNARLRLGWDDLLVTVGCFFAVGVEALYIALTLAGSDGHHIYDATYRQVYLSRVIPSGQAIGLYWAVTTTKMSVVLFYMRLNGFASRKWMIFHWTFIAILCCYLVTTTLGLVLVCTPVGAGFWNPAAAGRLNKKPQCMTAHQILSMLTAFNAIEISADIALLVVPVVMLWKVQMKWTIKLGVWSAGLVGIANIVTAIGRTAEDYTKNHKDYTYHQWSAVPYTTAEVTLGVITASLPVLSVLVKKSCLSIKHRFGSRPSAHHHPGNYVFSEAKRRKKCPARQDNKDLELTQTTASSAMPESQANLQAQAEQQTHNTRSLKHVNPHGMDAEQVVVDYIDLGSGGGSSSQDSHSQTPSPNRANVEYGHAV